MKLEEQGISQVINDFKGFVERMENPNRAFATIGEKARKDVIDHFDNEMGPSGGWAPLVRQRKPRQGQRPGVSDKILQDTGTLKGSIKKRVFPDKAEIYTTKNYAAIHNYGGETGRKEARFMMTARPFLWFSEKGLYSMAKTLAKYIIKNV